MVEQEIKAAPFTETKIRVLETTLAELGIDTSFDNLGLAMDRFMLGVKKVGEETVFVGLLHHPIAGGHFAQVLNRVSPFADQDVNGIINDINLPILAKRDYKALKDKDKITSGNIKRHERHLNDPRVGPPYIRFAEDHVDKWLKALKINTGLRVFERLQRIRFVNSREDLRRELFSEDGSLRKFLKDSDVAGFTTYARDIVSVLQRYEKFMDFWKKNLMGKGKEPVQAFLDTLTTKTEQEEFAISYFTTMGQIIADLETHRIIRHNVGNQSGKVKVKFDNNGRDIMVSNNTGTKVVISPTGENSEKFNWRIIDYQFSRYYIRHSVYPVLAWKKDANGNRSFLTQKEAMPYVAELGLSEGEQGDVKLGEIGVAYFARDIVKKWPTKMPLKPLEGVEIISRPPGFEQSMRAAQMPAWVAIEEHKAELLRSETSVLARSEQHLSSVEARS